MPLATPLMYGLRHLLRCGTASPFRTGSCISGGSKPCVLLDGGIFFGKLHFSLWLLCHNSFPRKSSTISTSHSAKRPSFMVCSCAAIPRTDFAATLKCQRWFSPSGTKKRSASQSCEISLLEWWNTAGTSWPSSTPWWARTYTTIESNKRRNSLHHSDPGLILRVGVPNQAPAAKSCPKVQVTKCQATLDLVRESNRNRGTSPTKCRRFLD
jgi:hypothetical protein